jgi:predicted MPP superfamily phosphohydrolase
MNTAPLKPARRREVADISTLKEAKPKKSTKEIPLVPVLGDKVARYSEAYRAAKNAEQVMTTLSAELSEAGVVAVFTNNCEKANDPKAQLSSVKLYDVEAEGEPAPEDAESVPALMVTWSKKTKKMDPAQVNATLTALLDNKGKKVDANVYAVMGVVASFDTKVFAGADGKFDQERYDAFTEAIEKVAKKFKVPCPLECHKEMMVTPNCHVARFQNLDVEANLAMQRVIPTSISLEPVVPVEQPEE